MNFLERTDLKHIAKDIKNGNITLDEINDNQHLSQDEWKEIINLLQNSSFTLLFNIAKQAGSSEVSDHILSFIKPSFKNLVQMGEEGYGSWSKVTELVDQYASSYKIKPTLQKLIDLGKKSEFYWGNISYTIERKLKELDSKKIIQISTEVDEVGFWKIAARVLSTDDQKDLLKKVEDFEGPSTLGQNLSNKQIYRVISQRVLDSGLTSEKFTNQELRSIGEKMDLASCWDCIIKVRNFSDEEKLSIMEKILVRKKNWSDDQRHDYSLFWHTLYNTKWENNENREKIWLSRQQ